MKAYPIESCYDCPDQSEDTEYDEFNCPVGRVYLCLHDWYEDRGEKRVIRDIHSIPDWCPLKDYKEDVNDA